MRQDPGQDKTRYDIFNVGYKYKQIILAGSNYYPTGIKTTCHALSIYHGHFCIYNSRKTPHSSSKRARHGVSFLSANPTEVWSLKLPCCVHHRCPACRTYEIATRFWEVLICPIYMCLTVYEFSFILFDLCLFITIFNFILNYVLIATFWLITYYKIWIMLIIYCFIWNYWFFLFCNMLGRVLECYELTGVSLLWPWPIKGK